MLKTKTNKNNAVERKQNCKFRILPFQPCGNPVFMRVQRISPAENRAAYVLNFGDGFTSASSPTRSLTIGRWACCERTVESRVLAAPQLSGGMRVTSACRVLHLGTGVTGARNGCSSGFLTLPAMLHPQQPSCCVRAPALRLPGHIISPLHQQSSVRRSAHDVTPCAMKNRILVRVTDGLKLSSFPVRQITKCALIQSPLRFD